MQTMSGKSLATSLKRKRMALNDTIFKRPSLALQACDGPAAPSSSEFRRLPLILLLLDLEVAHQERQERGEKDLADERLQNGENPGHRSDWHNVAIAHGCERAEAEIRQLGTAAQEVIDIRGDLQRLSSLEVRTGSHQLHHAAKIGECFADQQVNADPSQNRV